MSDELVGLLVDAKRKTYAATGDVDSVPPLLAGSKQIEYRSGRFAYREIYFGMNYFAGQETVVRDDDVPWSMIYAGGIVPAVTRDADVAAICGFLRQALMLVDGRRPFRGPSSFASGDFNYNDDSHGDFGDFHGSESILRESAPIDHLRYAGGLIH